MRLFIAEKPSVAKVIAEELGVTKKGNGFIECGSDSVTWCFGHMFEQAEPDEYTAADAPRGVNGKKVWRVEDLPIIPDDWIMRPKEDAATQIATIGKLIERASEVVNAGDPDREGQLLVDEVLNHFSCKAPVRRYWCNAQDAVSVRRSLAALSDNAKYKGFGNAAKARARVDWLIGMNLTRAYTLRAQRGGSRVTLTVGRVQTPTLALVVARDREIEAFKPVPFHTIRAGFQHGNAAFLGVWRANEDQAGLDSDGRLTDTKIADELVKSLQGQPGTVKAYVQTPVKESQPLSFSLTNLTLLASNTFGYAAADVLEICQSLYEKHKLTSYPRTDCGYLPEAQHADADAVLTAVKAVNPHLTELVEGADSKIKSRVWDDAKVTAHHGIIPTSHIGNANALSDAEKNVYSLIVHYYIAQFYPQHEYMRTNVEIDVAGETFTTSGKVVTKPGWRAVLAEPDDEEGGEDDASQALPKMAKDDALVCVAAKRMDSKTKAPARFTEGTLMKAMENIQRFVPDPEQKKILRETDGIGTEATRAPTIAELKERGYLVNKGKQIISSELGRSIIDALPELVKSPALTAVFERSLGGIEAGQGDVDEFVKQQAEFIRKQVAQANAGKVVIAGAAQTPIVSEIHKCMSCSKGLRRWQDKKNPKRFYWACSGYPTCKETYADIAGKPHYASVPKKVG